MITAFHHKYLDLSSLLFCVKKRNVRYASESEHIVVSEVSSTPSLGNYGNAYQKDEIPPYTRPSFHRNFDILVLYTIAVTTRRSVLSSRMISSSKSENHVDEVASQQIILPLVCKLRAKINFWKGSTLPVWGFAFAIIQKIVSGRNGLTGNLLFADTSSDARRVSTETIWMELALTFSITLWRKPEIQ